MLKIISWQQIMKPIDIAVEDGGMAKIWQPTENEDPKQPDDAGVFVRLQSYDENGAHELFNNLMGKLVRITVEIVEFR